LRVKASTIIKACNNREYERKWASRYASRGYPPLEVIWDVPKTLENLKLVKEFLLDYSPEFNPFAKFLRKLSAKESEDKSSLGRKVKTDGVV